MKILVFNGSPRSEKSVTMILTEAFLNGYKRPEDEIKIVDLSKQKISPCKGCYSCWTISPGKCIINDDARWILEEYFAADLVIWSSPLFFGGLTSLAKTIMDRLLPMFEPIIEKRSDGTSYHPYRVNLENQKCVLVSVCGFDTYLHNYEALEKQFDIVYGENCIAKIICVESRLFIYKAFQYKTDVYVENVRKAGNELRENSQISKELTTLLKKRMLAPERYIGIGNACCEVYDYNLSEKENMIISEKKKITQMMLSLNENSEKKINAVIEFFFEDTDYSCQVEIKNSICYLIDNSADFQREGMKLILSLKNWENVFLKERLYKPNRKNTNESKSDIQRLAELAESFCKMGTCKVIKI